MTAIPTKSRRLARRWLTVQTVAGLALIALAVPYSGCFTARVWNPDTVLIAARREGRTEFRGDLGDRLANTAGDLAYPGVMGFVDDDGKETSLAGWLIVPAASRASWAKRINRVDFPNIFASAPPVRGPGIEFSIAVNPPPELPGIGFYSSPTKFLEANGFPFHTKEDGFDPEKSGYIREPIAEVAPGQNIGAVLRNTPEENIGGFFLNGPVAGEPTGFGAEKPDNNLRMAGAPGLPYENLRISGTPEFGAKNPFRIVYNPIQRTGWSDALNTTGKVVLTVPAVAGDVVTVAAVTGGMVVAGGVALVAAPFVAVGKAVSGKNKPAEETKKPSKNPSESEENAPAYPAAEAPAK